MTDRERHELVRRDDTGTREALPPKPAHGDPAVHAESSPEALAARDSGRPGGGAGRRDVVDRTGVYPISGDERPSGEAELRPLGDWAGGDRGLEGYEDAGGSEPVMRDGQLLGGLSADGSGRPTTDERAAEMEAGRAGEAARRRRPDSPDAGS